jgi:hypothetical protein
MPTTSLDLQAIFDHICTLKTGFASFITHQITHEISQIPNLRKLAN